MSSKRIEATKVRRDNSDVWRYSTILFSELRKENYSKSLPESYNLYCEAVGTMGYSEPFLGFDLTMDIDTFKKTLQKADKELLTLLLLGMKHREISDIVGLSRSAVTRRLLKIKQEFKEFYLE
jgi:hypothetical protein